MTPLAPSSIVGWETCWKSATLRTLDTEAGADPCVARPVRGRCRSVRSSRADAARIIAKPSDSLRRLLIIEGLMTKRWAKARTIARERRGPATLRVATSRGLVGIGAGAASRRFLGT